jgi:trigger factor
MYSMSNQLEKLENSMVKIRMEVSREDFEAAVNTVYNKTKNQISVPGFRKGKAPRKLIEKTYGKEVFYEDAINEILPKVYSDAVEELQVEVMSRPVIDLEPIVDGAPIVITAEVAVKPEVKLCRYKSLKAEKPEVTVTDEEIEAELKKVAERNARVSEIDTEAQLEDTAVIDFEGFVDGVAFEGGKGEDFDLKLGSHSFIDTFEDQLVGKKAGDECEVQVTFPEEYHVKELAGKPATFKVTVKKVKRTELPAIDDDLAQDVSECNTLEEYKAEVKKNLEEKKDKEAEEARKKELMDKVIEKSTMEIPDAIIDTRAENMIEDMANNMRYQGLSMDQYLSMTGSNMASLKASIRPQAERRVKEDLVLEAIAKAEELEITEDDFNAEIEDMAKMYNMEAAKIKELLGENETKNIKDDMLKRKALDCLSKCAK